MDEHRTELMLAERADRVDVGPPPVDALLSLGRRRRARRRTAWVGAVVLGAAGVSGGMVLLSQDHGPTAAGPAATRTGSPEPVPADVPPTDAAVYLDGVRVGLVATRDLAGDWVALDPDNRCGSLVRIDEDGKVTPSGPLRELSCALLSARPGPGPAEPVPGIVRFEVRDDMLVAFDATGDRIGVYQRAPYGVSPGSPQPRPTGRTAPAGPE